MLRKDAKVEKLKRVPLFAGCSKAELARIASVADEVAFQPGRVLMKEGAPGREFVVVLEGTVELSKGGRRIPIKGGSDFFGELALLTNAPRTATVTTTSPVRALVITDRAFRQILDNSPQISAKILDALAVRIGDSL